VAHPGDQLAAQRFVRLHLGIARDIGIDALALDRMRHAHHGGFGDLGMGHQRAFDLGRAHAVARHVDRRPAGDPVIAVLVAAAAVAGEIPALERGEIGLEEALVSPQTVRIWPGQLSPITRQPSVAPSSTRPSLSSRAGCTPNIGLLADPGLSAVAPGRG
jgi:hypothetical protein